MQGFASFRVLKKLQMLKIRIKDWREVFGDLDLTRDLLVREVDGWDRVEERALSLGNGS